VTDGMAMQNARKVSYSPLAALPISHVAALCRTLSILDGRQGQSHFSHADGKAFMSVDARIRPRDSHSFRFRSAPPESALGEFRLIDPPSINVLRARSGRLTASRGAQSVGQALLQSTTLNLLPRIRELQTARTRER
jgi:hypothetical protein